MTALVHGPLAGQGLTQLTNRSVLQFDGEALFTFDRFQEDDEDDIVGAWLTRFGEGGPTFHPYAESFTFIGWWQDDAHTAILAPEGGWRENPVPGRMVEYQTELGHVGRRLSDELEWPQRSGSFAWIVAFSLIEDAKPEAEPLGVQLARTVGVQVAKPLTPIGEVAEAVKGHADRPAQALSGLAEMDGGLVGSDRAFALGALRAAKATLNGLGVTVGGRISMVEEAITRLSATPASPPAETGEGVARDHMVWMRKFVPCVYDVTEARLNEIDAFLARPSAQSDRERLRAALSGAFITTESVGNPDPEKRSATLKIAFYGEGCLDKAWSARDALAALAEKEAGQ